MKHIVTFLKTFKRNDFVDSLSMINTQENFNTIYRVVKKLDSTGNATAKAVREFGEKKGFFHKAIESPDYDSALSAILGGEKPKPKPKRSRVK